MESVRSEINLIKKDLTFRVNETPKCFSCSNSLDYKKANIPHQHKDKNISPIIFYKEQAVKNNNIILFYSSSKEGMKKPNDPPQWNFIREN